MSREYEEILKQIKTNNSSELKELFSFRRTYRDLSFAGTGIEPIDMREKKPFYGRIDNQHRAVECWELHAGLENISGNENVRALDFVAKAFSDFERRWATLRLTNRLYPNSSYYEIIPEKGFEDIPSLYQAYLAGIKEAFIDDYLTLNQREDSIVGIKDFLKHFMIFYKGVYKDFPITKTGFITSTRCSPMVSGLMIELSAEEHDDDNTKVQKYLTDSNFKTFLYTARNFGFRIDKHAPWRMVADLSSPIMGEYMNRFGISGKTLKKQVSRLFLTKYRRPSDQFMGDISGFLYFFTIMYNEWVDDNPILRKNILRSGCLKDRGTLGAWSSTMISSSSVIKRKRYRYHDPNRLTETEPAFLEHIHKYIAPAVWPTIGSMHRGEFWLNIYISLRRYETGRFPTADAFKKFREKVLSLVPQQKKRVDIRKALLYNEIQMKNCFRFSYNPLPEMEIEEIAALEDELEALGIM